MLCDLLIPQQQNAMGSLHTIDFSVLWASWGRSGKEPGSGNRFRFRVRVTGFALRERSSGNRVRVSMGSDRFCGSNVPGSEGCVPEVSKVSVFDGFRQFRFCSRGLDGTGSGNRVLGTRGIKKVPGPFPRFRKLLCILKEHFCTLKVYV